MTTFTEEVGRLLPPTDNSALVRGLLLGVAVGAAIAGVLILTHTLRERRTTRRIGARDGSGADPTTGAAQSPL